MKKYIFDTYKNVAEQVIPTLKNNNFKLTGMLTPDQFVKAGDHLVYMFPLWKWANTNKKDEVSFMPHNKQMIVMKNIPFYTKNILSDNTDINDWNIIKEKKNKILSITKKSTTKNSTSTFNDINLNEFEESSLEEEDLEIDDESSIIYNNNNLEKHIKLYDITITYDNYFRTPRIWFFGYTPDGLPLTYEKMTEDISKEHKGITVTLETHPFFDNLISLSVHPCKHAVVMKKLLNVNIKTKIEEYFIFFLKFVSCIIPSLDFDFTASC